MRRLLLLAFLFTLFTGCPTESNVPLSSDPMEKTDSSLFGMWKRCYDKPGADSTETVVFMPGQADSTYKIRRIGKRQKGDVTKRETIWFDAHVSILKEHRFLNLKMKSVDGVTVADSLRKYFIVQFEVHPGAEGDTLISRVYDGYKSLSIGDFRKSLAPYVNRDTGLSKFDPEYSALYYKKHRKK